MQLLSMDDNKKIGLGLVILGLSCYLLGIILFFDRALFLIANLSFLIGMYMFIGLKQTIAFFSKKTNFKGSLVYFGGFAIIVFGFSFIGFCIQMYGLFLLFKTFLPLLYDPICRIPIIGKYFRSDAVKNTINNIAQKGPSV
ncbi:Got1/SFT2 family protein (macronuclear) [Tetrahymena thermophila SB210]|uniref:Got1/SFT2 family protein n=1 Tax=Tetrahymena thermophila (strain SB210) TaxID=312017 RepID=W7XDH7_TETTS|nr:Got1/SFT2 family protein [Tetrahymena thermophila SB210]EWS71886.1 Got1/SFT2 family protein [Tetrahymena thermophila SB210]|eukprot:XP_012655580.1 Got1/SFT2 family protein [Tetrahymena thermophila SB210]